MMQKTPMKRSAPMSRGTGFARKAPAAGLKPPKGPKPKKCQNRACRCAYIPDPRTPFKTWCSDDCAVVIGLEKVAKQKLAKAKAERAEDARKKKEGMKPQERANLAQKAVNRYVLLRDYEQGCISCEKSVYWQGGAWHASHFKSRGASSGLRFHLWNIHKACDQCNYHKGGNIHDYEPRLVLKIGADKVEALKNFPRSREFSNEYLDRITSVFNKKANRMARRLGIKR